MKKTTDFIESTNNNNSHLNPPKNKLIVYDLRKSTLFMKFIYLLEITAH